MNGSSGANDDPFAGLDLSPAVSHDHGEVGTFQMPENPANGIASEVSEEEDDFCDFEDAVDAGGAIVNDAASESNNDDFEDAVAGDDVKIDSTTTQSTHVGTPEETVFDAFAALSGEPAVSILDGVAANGVSHEHAGLRSTLASPEDINSFGGFGSAPQSTTNAPLSTALESGVDGLSDFASAHQSTSYDTPTSSTVMEISEDDSGNSGFAPEVAISEPSESVAADTGSRALAEPALQSVVASPLVSALEDTSLAGGVTFDVLNADPVERPQQMDSTDGFGNFATSNTVNLSHDNSPTTTGEQQSPVKGDDGDDDFGDFDAAPSFGDKVVGHPDNGSASTAVTEGNHESETAAAEETETTRTSAEPMSPSTAPENDFGAFDSAPNEAEEQLVSVAVGADDDFGEFGAAPATVQSQGGVTVGDALVENDDFGDFGAAPSSAETDTHTNDGQLPESNPADVMPAKEEDFGDFGAAPLAINNAPPMAGNEDDGFGDFDAAPVAPNETTSKDVAINANDDEFGDFDAAPGMEGKPSSEEDDDFGDFDAAPVSAEEKPSSEDDDDFGDFDASPVSAEEKPSSEEDDDFGDFDAAPVSAEEKPSSEEDDDFGDFDAAPVSAEEKPSSQEEEDFGDFDAAPVTAGENPSRQEDDDFGDFGDFNDTVGGAETESELPQSQAPASDDPVVVRTKTFFPRLFANYSPQANESPRDEDLPSDVASLSDILSSFGECSTENRCSAHIALVKMLQEASLQDKLDSRAVVRPGATGPFSHLAFPLGDPRLPDVHSQQIAKGLAGTGEPYLPDVLPVQLPASPGRALPSTLDSSSQSKGVGSPAVREGPASGTKVTDPLPSGASSEQARHVLSQIPDLSYMLSPKLQLPSAG